MMRREGLSWISLSAVLGSNNNKYNHFTSEAVKIIVFVNNHLGWNEAEFMF
jgi:hypothetical protein